MGMAIQTVADPADRGKLGRVHAVPQDGVEVTLEAGILSLAVKAVPFEVKGISFARSDRGVAGAASWSCQLTSTPQNSPRSSKTGC